jgi:hypothetical protein
VRGGRNDRDRCRILLAAPSAAMPHHRPEREPWPSRKGPGKRRARPDQRSRRSGSPRSRRCHANSISRGREKANRRQSPRTRIAARRPGRK